MSENYRPFGTFPDKESFPHIIHVHSKTVDSTNCIIASTSNVFYGGFTQLRMTRQGRVALIRFDSKKSNAPYPYEKAKILWDSRKHKTQRRTK